jgi:hypothetical protein
MRRTVWIGVIAAIAFAVSVLPALGAFGPAAIGASGPAAPALTSTHVRVTTTPKRGSTTTAFVIRFRAPVATGVLQNVRREFDLNLSGPTSPAGCVTEGSLELPPAQAQGNVKATLRPRRFGGARWCPGAFRGQIHEIQAPVCPAREICPALVVLLGTVGTFSFQVTPPGGDVTAPRFAGLTRATACTPGAQRPGEKTPALLTWNSARDNRTLRSRLVYDVYMSSTPGGEDFLSPTWTTKPGVSRFRTPGLPAHGAAYFVVRARDQAGNEDGNTVERALTDPCL